MLESLAGKPGRPRVRPPYAGHAATSADRRWSTTSKRSAHATEVAILGGAAFARHGTKNSTGSKILSVSGDCELPGVYEYSSSASRYRRCSRTPAPTRDVAAVQIGGPSAC